MQRPSPFLTAFCLSLAFPPITLYSLFYSTLVTEVVPSDQGSIPMPSTGDRVSIMGVWVMDTELTEWHIGGWYELHPVRFMEINGKPHGKLDFGGNPMDGVWNPGRLIVLDKQNPYRTVSGTVAESFKNFDGDYHVHVILDKEYLGVLKPNAFAAEPSVYPIFKVLSYSPLAVLVAYAIYSWVRPENTRIGKWLRRRPD